MQALVRRVLPAALGCLAVPYLFDGIATLWHGIPGVCSEHDHTWQELLVFCGLGSAVSLFAAFMMWLAWRVWSAPSVATIYWAWLLVLFAVSTYAPLLPGMTKATSDSLWGVALWTAFWLGGPRIVQLFGLEEDLESRYLLGVWLFCVTAPFLLLPVGNLSMILKSPGGSHRTGFTWLLLLGLLGALRLLYLGMVRWRRQGSHVLPALAVAAVTSSVLLSADLAYQYWWPNPLDLRVAQDRPWIPNKGRRTWVVWPGKAGIAIFDDLESPHQISKTVGPTAVTITGEISGANEPCRWVVSNSAEGSLQMRINSKEYDVSDERAFLITAREGLTDVQQASDASQFYDVLDQRHYTKPDFWPLMRSESAMEVGADGFVRQINLYYRFLSAGNGSVFGRELIPAVRFVDSMECSHKVTREEGDSDVTINGALLFDDGDAYKWTVVGEKHSLEWSGQPGADAIQRITIDGAEYDKAKGICFYLSRERDRLIVRQEKFVPAY